ncbi:hypothetical protein QUA81_13280 [Microcoleus sp. F6_B4]
MAYAPAYAYGQSNDFAIPNDLVLANAIQALREIYHAIVESEYYFPGREREILSTYENINVFDLLGSSKLPLKAYYRSASLLGDDGFFLTMNISHHDLSSEEIIEAHLTSRNA